MNKTLLVSLVMIAVLLALLLLQFQTAARLRAELATAGEENARLRKELAAAAGHSYESGSLAGAAHEEPSAGPGEPKRVQELESEVMRLRGATSRALRAETEVAQLKSELEDRRLPATPGGSESNSIAGTLLAYLGEPVPPPANLDAAYTREGLLNAIHQAAQNAGVSLKKVEIEATEFPFLVGVTCQEEADFEKLKVQLSKVSAYEYGGGVSGHTSAAFNITPHRAYSPEAGQRISRRTMLREQMFFDQLGSSQN